MRAALCLLVIALLLPAGGAPSGRRVAIFYYPWYGNPRHDGRWMHWNQAHARPPRIATAYYPARGLYSSGDARVVRAQLREIASAGIDEVIVSWWGRGSPEDRRLRLVLAEARRADVEVAAHVEPYGGRSVESIRADIEYLHRRGIRDFYVFGSLELPGSEWVRANRQLDGVRVFANTALVGRARREGFDGVYTYNPVVYPEHIFRRICAEARAAELLCAPSVAPGFDARRATRPGKVRKRLGGRTYDTMWRAALGAGADVVTITSYNEWHEGTQIEPASTRAGYASYRGAYGTRGGAASRAYLVATARWSKRAHSKPPVH